MAMINCPECGKQISDKAKFCPNCGAQITKPENTGSRCPTCNGNHVVYQTVTEKHKSGRGAIITLVVLTVLCMCFCWLIFPIILAVIFVVIIILILVLRDTSPKAVTYGTCQDCGFRWSVNFDNNRSK